MDITINDEKINEILKLYDSLNESSQTHLKLSIIDNYDLEKEWRYLDLLEKRVNVSDRLNNILDNDGKRIYTTDEIKAVVKLDV